MRRLVHALNVACLGACFLITGLLALPLALGFLGSLLSLDLYTTFTMALLLACAAAFIRLLQRLWRWNQDYAQAIPGSESVAFALPLLAAVLIAAGWGALRKVDSLLRPSSAKATIGSLGALRSALSIYYGDMEGQYPGDFALLLERRKYLSEVPQARTLDHPDNRDVTHFGSQAPLDTGTWGYVNNPYDRDYGHLFIDCTHTDPRGSVWTGY